jgi:tetratricopeptide (TPR) repeat protein
MAALFVLLAFCFYLKRQLLPLLLSLAVALLCRENALMLVPILILYHGAWKKPIWTPGFLGALFLSGGYLLLRAKILSGLLITTIGANQPSTWERLPSFFMAFPQYLRLLVFPFGLHMEYGSILFPWSEPGVILGIIIFGGYCLTLFFVRKRSVVLFWCLAFFLLGLLPVCHLFLINAYMAEHWLYLPSLGFFWILAYSFKGRKTLLALAVGITLYFSALTVYQNQFWRDPVLFYKTLMRYAPNSPKVYNNLAKVYHEQGKKDELINLLKTALSVDSRNFAALNNLGNALKDAGRFKEAEESYLKAIELEPTGAHQYMNLSLLYSEVYKDKAKAVSLLEKAIQSNPRCAEAYHQLGFLAVKDQEWEKAITYIKKELEIYPDQASAYKLMGYVYFKTEQWALAESSFLKAIQYKPDLAEAYHDLAVVYAGQGKNHEAHTFAKRAEELGFKDPEFYRSLSEK